MSRYDWPDAAGASTRRRDNALRRAAWRERLLGAVPAELVERAATERARRGAAAAAFRAPLDAPAGDVDLWLPVGPTSVIRGQAGSRPRVAGRVRDLRVSPDGQRAYAATANGGVWFSGDGGVTWFPLGAWATTPSAAGLAQPANILVCGALHVTFGAAASGADDVVHVATGELRPYRKGTPGGQLGGIGILHLAVSVPAALADPFLNPWRREANNLTGFGIFRIDRDPADADRLVAATSAGLYVREGGFVENADWTKITADPFDFEADDPMWTSDLVWAPAQGGTPSRLWVALVDTSEGFFDPDATGVYVSENGTAGPFTRVTLAGHVFGGRLGIAVAPSDRSVVYVLGAGPRLWRIDGTTARRVADVPNHLFGETHDQSEYDLAVDVHPTNPNRIAVGGSTLHADGQWGASLFRLNISCPAAGCTSGFSAANQANPVRDSTFIGNGVHADVHALRWIDAPGGVQLWVGCDGGVFRSGSGGDRHTFTARNNGLAVLEPGYVANHPTSDGFILAGTQDNGMIRCLGAGLWDVRHMGDGGGVTFHPVTPYAWAVQYTGADWLSNENFEPPVLRRSTASNPIASETAENDASSFYSGIAAMPAGGNRARIAIGTNRVWVSETWEPSNAAATMTWVTLPSSTDPRFNSGDDVRTDTFEGHRGQVIALRWMDGDRLLVLCRSAVLLFRRTSGTWQRIVLSNHSEKCGDFDNDDVPQPTSDFMPPLGAWSDIAVHDAARGAHGSFYVSATGHARLSGNAPVESPRMDTLWWFDGTETWHPTGLRNEAGGGKAPAYCVVTDPDDASIVYVGTAIGVWRGQLASTGGSPDWTWRFFDNGLPEAAVQDLAFFHSGAIKLLRAAVQARGVWEVDLSAAPTSPRQTYLRVHPYDTRRRLPTPLADPTKPEASSGTPAEYAWNYTPDIRIRRAPGALPPTAPPTLPWNGAAANDHQLWAFQTALRSVDPLVQANARWTDAFAARLRAFRAASSPPAANAIDQATWDAVMAAGTAFQDPWDPPEPTEADLHELVHERKGGSAADTYTFASDDPHRVHVLVHHRDSRPIDGSDVTVLLLRRPLTGGEAAGAAVAINDAWKTAVEQRLGGATPALPDGWEAVGATGHPAGPVDARIARAVTFDLDLTAETLGSVILLLAIVSSTEDPVTAASLTGGTVRDLVLGCRHVAARTLLLVLTV